MGPTDWPKKPVTISNLHCVTYKKTENLKPTQSRNQKLKENVFLMVNEQVFESDHSQPSSA